MINGSHKVKLTSHGSRPIILSRTPNLATVAKAQTVLNVHALNMQRRQQVFNTSLDYGGMGRIQSSTPLDQRSGVPLKPWTLLLQC